MVFNAFSVLGIPSRDTQNTNDLGTGVPKTRGYPNHCDSGICHFENRRGEGPGDEVESAVRHNYHVSRAEQLRQAL